MRWRKGRRSRNVEDRRSGKRTGGKLGLGAIVIILIAWWMGADPSQLMSLLSEGQGQVQSGETIDAAQDELADFVSVVLADTEDTWHKLLRQTGQAYREPKLVLFRQSVRSACGFAQSAMGPFYCPADEKVYIDLEFYETLRTRFGANGDFAQAFVIAHEVGHHIQNLLGVSDQVNRMRSQLSEAEFNRLSVRMELQADFYAGVWAHHAHRARHILEAGDVEEALRAASAIGDDRLQMQSRGYVVPDSFTHGTSEQRMRWFQKGLETGDLRQGNTFDTHQL